MNTRRVGILGSVALGLAAPFMLSSSQPYTEQTPPEQKIVLNVPESRLMADPNAGLLRRTGYEPFDTQVIDASYDAPVLVYFGAPWDAKFNKEKLIPEIQKIYAPLAEAGWKHVSFNIDDGKKTMIPDEHGKIGRDWTEELGITGVPSMLFVYRGGARRLPQAQMDNVEEFLALAIRGLTPEGRPQLSNQTVLPRYNSYHSPFNYPRPL